MQPVWITNLQSSNQSPDIRTARHWDYFFSFSVYSWRERWSSCETVGVPPLKLRVLRLAFAAKRPRVIPPPCARNEASIWWTPGSSAGQQAGRVVDKTAELIGQVSVVFGQKAAHFYIQEIFCQILHDGSCCWETPHVKKHTKKNCLILNFTSNLVFFSSLCRSFIVTSKKLAFILDSYRQTVLLDDDQRLLCEETTYVPSSELVWVSPVHSSTLPLLRYLMVWVTLLRHSSDR